MPVRLKRALATLLLLFGAACAEPVTPPLEVMVKLTGGARGPAALPLVIGIHGLGDQPENFSKGFAPAIPARLVFLRAPHPYGSGFSWFDKLDDPVELRRSGELVVASIRSLLETHAVKGRPVVFGYSQGGILTLWMAAHHPELVSHAIAVAGFLPEASWPTAAADRTEVHAFNGTADRRIPFARAFETVQAFSKLPGYRAEIQDYPDLGHALSFAAWEDVSRALFDAITDQTEED